jgi:hypothetical protein
VSIEEIPLLDKSSNVVSENNIYVIDNTIGFPSKVHVHSLANLKLIESCSISSG